MVETGLRRIDPKKGKKLVLEEDGDCIICTSHAPNADGYIRLFQSRDKDKQFLKMLHRMVWEHNVGEIPVGYEVDHICRNRKCCKLAHLQLLTVSEHKSKTNRERYADRIASIKAAIKEGIVVKDIAKEFGVSRHTVCGYKRQIFGARSYTKKEVQIGT